MTDRIEEIQETLQGIANHQPCCKILMSIPGIGVINATSIYSAIARGEQFKTARECAVWLGLTPRQSGSGEKLSLAGSLSEVIVIYVSNLFMGQEPR